jgi:hypothetical protein
MEAPLTRSPAYAKFAHEAPREWPYDISIIDELKVITEIIETYRDMSYKRSRVLYSVLLDGFLELLCGFISS